MNGKILYIVLALAIIAAPPVMAQIDNSNATFVLDFDVETDGVQAPGTWNAGGSYDVDLVLQNAQNVIGVNCDIVFATADITINLVHEKLGDLNFDSISNLNDLATLGRAYNSVAGDENYEAAYDLNGDGSIDLSELSNLGRGYKNESRYWTDAQAADGELDEASHESVNIVDPVDTMNEEGLINDIVAVLLRRPGDEDRSVTFDGDGRAIATIKLTVNANASGSTTFNLIDETDASTIDGTSAAVVLDTDDTVSDPTKCKTQDSTVTIQ